MKDQIKNYYIIMIFLFFELIMMLGDSIYMEIFTAFYLEYYWEFSIISGDIILETLVLYFSVLTAIAVIMWRTPSGPSIRFDASAYRLAIVSNRQTTSRFPAG